MTKPRKPKQPDTSWLLRLGALPRTEPEREIIVIFSLDKLRTES